MEDKVFLFCHFLKKKNPMLYRIYCHFITWICSILSNVFLPSCPMYWWSVSSDSMLSNPTKKKCMASWQEKSLLVCVWSRLSAYPLISFFVSISPPPMSSTMSVMKLSLYFPSSFFYVVSFCLVRLIAPLKPNKWKELAYLCCNGHGYYCSF